MNAPCPCLYCAVYRERFGRAPAHHEHGSAEDRARDLAAFQEYGYARLCADAGAAGMPPELYAETRLRWHT